MVSFGQAIKTCFIGKIFNYHDRAPRSEFWWFILFSWILSIIMAPLQMVVVIGQLLAIVVGFWMFIASISVSVRRMHDLNRSGWWLLFPYFCFFVGAIVAVMNFIVLGFTIMALGGIVTIALWIMMIFRGTIGANRYGEDPIA